MINSSLHHANNPKASQNSKPTELQPSTITSSSDCKIKNCPPNSLKEETCQVVYCVNDTSLPANDPDRKLPVALRPFIPRHFDTSSSPRFYLPSTPLVFGGSYPIDYPVSLRALGNPVTTTNASSTPQALTYPIDKICCFPPNICNEHLHSGPTPSPACNSVLTYPVDEVISDDHECLTCDEQEDVQYVGEDSHVLDYEATYGCWEADSNNPSPLPTAIYTCETPEPPRRSPLLTEEQAPHSYLRRRISSPMLGENLTPCSSPQRKGFSGFDTSDGHLSGFPTPSVAPHPHSLSSDPVMQVQIPSMTHHHYCYLAALDQCYALVVLFLVSAKII